MNRAEALEIAATEVGSILDKYPLKKQIDYRGNPQPAAQQDAQIVLDMTIKLANWLAGKDE